MLRVQVKQIHPSKGGHWRYELWAGPELLLVDRRDYPTPAEAKAAGETQIARVRERIASVRATPCQNGTLRAPTLWTH